MIVSKLQGHGAYHARVIRQWIHTFISSARLPLHHYHGTKSSILEDEDISLEIQLKLSARAKEGFIKAQDVVEIVASPEIQTRLAAAGIQKRNIKERTARDWLQKFKWRYSKRKNGMYIDGHEREDVVEYRKGFVKRFLTQYNPRMHTWDKVGNETRPSTYVLPTPNGARSCRLILITHDESTFYLNDQRKTHWIHESQKNEPQPKGDGASVMISDFLTSEWGLLKSRDGTREARVVFKAGKNRDGYFDNSDILRQVDLAIDLFEDQAGPYVQGLFLFDNAPSHQKRHPDARSARHMPKNPKLNWVHHKEGLRMRPGVLPNGGIQSFYFPDDHPEYPGWFKGMQQILKERGLYPEKGLNAQCEGFKCESGKSDCCCRRLLFNQPDFTNQPSALEELITSRGHLCDFYPKYHCELNFIEMYWGAAKFHYRNHVTRPSNLQEMEARIVECLDYVPLAQMRR
ncbi:hypothetical protein DFH05DRAFT_1406735 [Lentinula detonsa]|uniref:Tc1-like transposase DDE domain-containing protein n=1 Tax=Lentinula detonsa TaxID=2804962 RepID=A0A9W8NS99_9AGAR|nr:hypothetical protein DFH05DRAFT_1406735 [Lentinula detonsa]